jgi:hypothetical protein
MLQAKILTDDEKDNHPFYSSWGIAQHKKRLMEREYAEKEEKKAKANPREEAIEPGDQDLEEERSGKGRQPMRVVRKRTTRPKRAPCDIKKVEEADS